MGDSRKALAGRVRWLVTFVLFLLALSAVPVLAEPAQEPTPEQIEDSLDLGDKSPPDAADIAAGLRGPEAEEAAREQWLKSYAIRNRYVAGEPPHWLIHVKGPSIVGDSGSPVWNL